MLSLADPPICVGLYARWGSGKTFMISLLKREFDKTVREDPVTKQLLQFFEEGYEELVPAEDAKPEPIGFLICGLLFNILHAFMPTVPYWMSTILSIIWDVLDFRKAFAGLNFRKGEFTRVAVSDVEATAPKIESKEYIFVHFNAWECAACSHLSPNSARTGDH